MYCHDFIFFHSFIFGQFQSNTHIGYINPPVHPFLSTSTPSPCPCKSPAPGQHTFLFWFYFITQLRAILPKAFPSCDTSKTFLAKYGWNPLSAICTQGETNNPFLLLFSPPPRVPDAYSDVHSQAFLFWGPTRLACRASLATWVPPLNPSKGWRGEPTPWSRPLTLCKYPWQKW